MLLLQGVGCGLSGYCLSKEPTLFGHRHGFGSSCTMRLWPRPLTTMTQRPWGFGGFCGMTVPRPWFWRLACFEPPLLEVFFFVTRLTSFLATNCSRASSDVMISLCEQTLMSVYYYLAMMHEPHGHRTQASYIF